MYEHDRQGEIDNLIPEPPDAGGARFVKWEDPARQREAASGGMAGHKQFSDGLLDNPLQPDIQRVSVSFFLSRNQPTPAR